MLVVLAGRVSVWVFLDATMQPPLPGAYRGNNEKQKYTNSGNNVRVANGSLYITALRSPGSCQGTMLPQSTWYQVAGSGPQLLAQVVLHAVGLASLLQTPLSPPALWCD